jgi:hypothetical protein
VRLRVLVVVAFLAMAAVPAWLAWRTGVLPGPSQAAAGSTSPLAVTPHVIAAIAWPEDPLGLAASDTRVYWEQRDPDPSVSGLWYYDVTTGQVDRLLSHRAIGNASGFPAAAGDLVVWSASAGKRGAGTPSVEAYDGLTWRRWQVAASGRAPTAADAMVIWVEPGGAGHSDAIRGIDTLTDEEHAIAANGGVRALAMSGRRLAWIAGGAEREVWVGSLKSAARRRLAENGTAVAVDHNRVVWAAAIGSRTSSIVCRDLKTGSTTILGRQAGDVSSLTLSKHYAAWVTGRKSTGPQVWVYDFGRRSASQVGAGGGREVSPVIVAGSVYWAGDQSGRWELYSRSLQD